MNSFARAGLTAISVTLIKFCRGVWRRPKLTAALVFLITAIAVTQLPKMKFLLSADDMIGEGFASADELKSIKERYKDGQTAMLLLFAPARAAEPNAAAAGFTPEELCRIRKWFANERLELPTLKNSRSSFDIKKPTVGDARTLTYPPLIDLDCDNINLKPEDLARIKNDFDQSPWPIVHAAGSKELSLILSFTFKDAGEDRRLEPRPGERPDKFGSFDPVVLEPLRHSLETDLAPRIPGLKYYWVGPADYQFGVRQGLRFSSVLNLAMICFLIVALRAAFGTWAAGFIFAGTLVVSSAWLYGLKAMTGSPFDVLSNSLFLILGVSTLEDFTFLSFEQMKGRRWRESVRRLIVPSFFTSLTTIIGFISLEVSDLQIIKRLGAWSALGALIEWVFLFALLPPLLRFFFKRDVWVDRGRSLFFKSTGEVSRRRFSKRAVRLSLVVYPAAILSCFLLNVNDAPEKLFKANDKYRAGFDVLAGSHGWRGQVSLLMDEPASLEKLDAWAGALEKTNAGENIAAWESPGRLIDYLVQNQPPGRRDIIRTEFKTTLNRRQLVDDHDLGRAVLYLKRLDLKALETLKTAAREICGASCHLGGSLIAYADFSSLVPATLLESMSTSLILVSLVIAFLALAFGQIRNLPRLLLSSFWGPFAMLVILAALQLEVNFLTCIFASVLVGLTGDNAIQFLFAAKHRPLSAGVAERGGASVQTSVIMAAASLVFLASYFDPPRVFGLLLGCGLLLALAGDLWLLNGFINEAEFDSKEENQKTD